MGITFKDMKEATLKIDGFDGRDIAFSKMVDTRVDVFDENEILLRFFSDDLPELKLEVTLDIYQANALIREIEDAIERAKEMEEMREILDHENERAPDTKDED